ncbi:PTS sugar transporter subunit IIA [Peribacillus faecalis]|nr:PTS glucose transporter subunit IIA [Peribacillus faecalis]
MFLKKLFSNKEQTVMNEILVAPATGKLVVLEEVPDPVFSQKMMGDGLAFNPIEGEIVAPVDAKVIQVFPTKHAIGLKTENNIEILIHIGLETVSMKGEGFEVFVKEGDRVKKGQKLVTFDLDLIREKAKSTITPIVITNFGDVVEKLEKTTAEALIKGETSFMTVVPKN